MTNSLTHFDKDGQAHMVDVADKNETRRSARASGRIRMNADTLALIATGSVGKGDVLGVARIAAIQASKRHLRIDSAVPPLVSDQDYGGI